MLRMGFGICVYSLHRFMLENCQVIVCDENEDLKREGINSITLASSILKFKNPPRLEEGQTEATRGAEMNGENHKYWFIIRTPSRDYIFACNSVGQRSQWMFALNKIIREADVRAATILDL